MSGPQFLTEPEPPRGLALPVAPGVRRMVANNPSAMTYRGTNTYFLDADDGVSVIDPGPDDPAHVAAILAQAGAPILRIILTHNHRDHAGALPDLAAASGAAVLRFDEATLAEGADIAGWQVLHTPGHTADHVSLARPDGVVLTGDHVMSFASSVVLPPEGRMANYMASLRKLLARDDALYLPGHGPPLTEPRGFAEALLQHRLQREAAIVRQVRHAPATAAGIVDALYVGLDPKLHWAAEASVRAHLLKLQEDGLAVETEGVWRS